MPKPLSQPLIRVIEVWVVGTKVARVAPVVKRKPVDIAYHQLADGTLIELVDRGAFADWNGFLTGQVKFAMSQ